MRRAGVGVARAGRRRGEIEVLPDAELDAKLVVEGAGVGIQVRGEHVRVHEREVADEDGHAFPESSTFAAPARATVLGDGVARGSTALPAGGRHCP